MKCTNFTDCGYLRSKENVLMLLFVFSSPTEYKGHTGHVLRVEVLAAEQTWHTPSLLQARDDRTGGTAVFSQVLVFPFTIPFSIKDKINNTSLPVDLGIHSPIKIK